MPQYRGVRNTHSQRHLAIKRNKSLMSKRLRRHFPWADSAGIAPKRIRHAGQCHNLLPKADLHSINQGRTRFVFPALPPIKSIERIFHCFQANLSQLEMGPKEVKGRLKPELQTRWVSPFGVPPSGGQRETCGGERPAKAGTPNPVGLPVRSSAFRRSGRGAYADERQMGPNGTWEVSSQRLMRRCFCSRRVPGK